MKKEIIDILTERTNTLLAVEHCCAELKEAGRKWLNAIGTDSEKEAAAAYVAELEEDVMPIDGTIEFFKTPAAEAHFGKETAAAILEGLIAHKAAGGKYCNCAACAAGEAVLEYKAELLAD